jgi:hypothetical protein
MKSSNRSRKSMLHVWQAIQRVLRENRRRNLSTLNEEATFYIYRTDTNSVLARGIRGYDAAKVRANQIRRQFGLKWKQVAFRAEKRNQEPAASASKEFGVSAGGKWFTDANGKVGRMDYSPRYNPSKRTRFRGSYDADGSFHDID